jgi:hypothetical protein
MQLGPPEPLAASHRLDDFECGEAVLGDWLKRRALSNQSSGASRTFVVTDEDAHVRGYYAMAAGAVAHQLATSGVRRNMPDPVPVMVLARLAVDRSRLATGRGQSSGGRIAERGRQSPSRACPTREGQAVLRALRVSALADASDDAHAALEQREGLTESRYGFVRVMLQ